MIGSVFQGPEILIILLFIVLLIWGPTKLPQLARGIGRALYEFRKASQGLLEEAEASEKAKSSLDKVDEETLRKIAEKLGIEAENKSKDQLIKEVIEEARKKGILDEIRSASNK